MLIALALTAQGARSGLRAMSARALHLVQQPRCEIALETHAHHTLKRLALEHLRRLGCRIMATEVACPVARFRLDVAAYVDTERTPTIPLESAPIGYPDVADTDADHAVVDHAIDASAPTIARHDWSPRRRVTPYTVIIECKQSRADFLRDAGDHAELLRERDDLLRLRVFIEAQRIQRDEPHLRRASRSLFGECEEWDYARTRDAEYRRVLKQLARLDARLYGDTKFHIMATYGLADRLVIATPAGLIARAEVPAGWGLLECDPNSLNAEDASAGGVVGTSSSDDLIFNERIVSTGRASTPRLRDRLLRNIAVAATRAVVGPPPSPET